jgi:hypothetical protein
VTGITPKAIISKMTTSRLGYLVMAIVPFGFIKFPGDGVSIQWN